ncbi:MAG: ABC transporter ATP-binding protein [Deltaproteobacteria bacterium]|nr:MAG: ABC transporter ATP-binding protein [Deltaproteobacteria bacterium]
MVHGRGLVRTYRSGPVETPVLQGADLDIEAGSFAVIVGPSGSGKTTLLNLIGGLEPPDAGTLQVAGVDLGRADDAARQAFRRAHVGWVFQFFHLLPVLTAAENVRVVLEGLGVSKREARDSASEMLARVGLSGKEDRLPGQLSGGEQQRVGLARALAKRPPLLLADEPTGSLDRRLGEDIVELLTALVAETRTTVVTVTHDPKVVRAGTEVLEIRDGRVSRSSG